MSPGPDSTPLQEIVELCLISVCEDMSASAKCGHTCCSPGIWESGRLEFKANLSYLGDPISKRRIKMRMKLKEEEEGEEEKWEEVEQEKEEEEEGEEKEERRDRERRRKRKRKGRGKESMRSR